MWNKELPRNQRVREMVEVCHENVGWNLRISTMEICSLHHEPSMWTLGTSNAALATYWKRTRGTPSKELDKQIWPVLSNKTLGWLEERGYGCGPMDDGDGWVREILYKVAELVSLIVPLFEPFVPVRALNRAALHRHTNRLLRPCQVGPARHLRARSGITWHGHRSIFFCHCYLCMPVFSRTPLSWPMKKSKFHATQKRVWTSPRNNSWSKFVGWRHCLYCKPHWGCWSASPRCGRCWWRAGVQIRQCELAVIFMHNLMRQLPLVSVGGTARLNRTVFPWCVAHQTNDFFCKYLSNTWSCITCKRF